MINSFRLAFNLATRGKRILEKSRLLLTLSLSLGVAALVALETFTQRIENTILRDTKNLLAADFQVQSWRPFEPSVYSALEKEFRAGGIVQQIDFVSSLKFKPEKGEETFITISARGLEGEGFPFYGNFITEPSIKIEDLKNKAEVIIDKSLQNRGLKIGDKVEIGRAQFIIKSILLEEPQSAAGAFAIGPRVIFHKSMAAQTGLTGRGSRVFHQLLIRSSLSTTEFKKSFREKAPDPHWRLVSPEHANNQAARVLDRLRNFLGFVGLAALLLGGVGIFTVFRSQFFAQLSHLLTLRCLGISKNTLYLSAFIETAFVGLIGWILGSLGGFGTEAMISSFARSALDTDLANIKVFQPLFLGGFLSLLTLFLAVWVPMSEILRLPVSNVIRQDEAQNMRFSWVNGIWLFMGAALLILGVSRNLKLSSFFILGLVLASLLLLGISLFQTWLLGFSKGLTHRSFSLKHGVLGFLRKPTQSQTISVCLGLSLFLVLTLLWIAQSLRDQLNISSRIGVPNIFVLGIPEELLEPVRLKLPTLKTTPITQARIHEIAGVSIESNLSSLPEDDPDRFFQTREYFITRRFELRPGERILSGEADGFGPALSKGWIRASIEESFAKRMKLNLRDSLKIEISGVELEARVQSIRKVDWFNLEPNFFIVIHPDDLEGAPLDSVGFARIPSDQIPAVQSQLMREFPEVTVLDAESLSRRLLNILDQLAFAVFSMSLFSVVSCFFVFLGLALSRSRNLAKEIGLWRALGTPFKQILFILETESFLAGFTGVVAGSAAATFATVAACRWVFDIPLGTPPFFIFGIAAITGPLVLAFIGRLMGRSLIHKATADLFRVDG